MALGGGGLVAGGTSARFSDSEGGDASFSGGNWSRAVFSRTTSTIDLLDTGGTTTAVGTNSSPAVVGPVEEAFSNLTGPYHAPYLYRESDLRLVDFVSGTEIVLDVPSGTSYSSDTGRSVLATGRWVDDTGNSTAVSLFYVAKNGTSINRVVPTEPSSGSTVSLSTSNVDEVADISTGVTALLGIADLDGDGERELYVVSGSGTIEYLPLGGSSLEDTGSDALDTRNAAGAPRPTHIGRYGLSIPYVYRGAIKLLYYDGGYRTTEAFTYAGLPTEDRPAEAPVRICDYDGDGRGELLYVTRGTSNELRYADIPATVSDTVSSGTDTGSDVTAGSTKTGIV